MANFLADGGKLGQILSRRHRYVRRHGWLTQTATLRRETIHASLLASVVGIPVALLWRGRSERLERRLVEKVIPGILGALVDANEGHAGYR
jgi:hypothetical protein